MFALPDCAPEIADYYQVPIEIVAAVRLQESGSRGQLVGRIGPNENGTYDLGAMQVNTWWLDQETNRSYLQQWGITERELLENECTNIAVGTWILYDNITRYGEWEAALAAYNAGSPDSPVGQQYANEVLATLGDQYQ
ncbi:MULTISPECIES: lytic transglycosylase domain-containing protein [Halomonadaceae]|uniref:lytic transglycosylase domain-containing protein n=1 Tax=Halomonadaceae TaxID=28256 RepID=UPI00022D277F|nr:MULTISPECIES: lytic transglycosylase domain-containing protein [Halomonas]EHA15291.1 lytic transglycosylase catalytic subunit [Halomonas sp. HAL1]WKV95254.1 lytic transglycosylase domain-containing protein [Halomonas sp. HAL1]